MCGTVLTEKAKWVDRSSIIPLSVEDENSIPVQKQKKIFEGSLEEKLKEKIKGLQIGKEDKPPGHQHEDEQAANDELEKTPHRVEYEPWSLEELGYKPGLGTVAEDELPPEIADADDFDFNSYISAKVKLPVDGHTFANATVVRRARDECGELIGKSHGNPMMDTSLYEVRFEDGAVERYSANIIAENIYSQVDKDGTILSYVQEIVGH